MPTSFWIFLIICIASFVIAIDDHSEEWKEFKELKGGKQWWRGLKIFTLWFVCVGSLIGTLVLGLESLQDARKDAEREAQYEDVTNQLAQATAQLDGLKARMRHRRLSEDQKELLSLAVNTSNKGFFPDGWPRDKFPVPIAVVGSTWSDQEAGDLADDFVSVLTNAGWKVMEDKTLLNSRFGIQLGVTSDTPSDMLGLQPLRNGLETIGVRFEDITVSNTNIEKTIYAPINAGWIYLYIEQKP